MLSTYYVYTHPTSGNLRLATCNNPDHVPTHGRLTVHDSTGTHVVKSCNLAVIAYEHRRKLFPVNYSSSIQLDVTGFNLSPITPDTHPELFL